ncbi:hypothetical protein D9M73_194020 [compost metagenome]
MEEQREARRFAIHLADQHFRIGSRAEQVFVHARGVGGHLMAESFVFGQFADQGEDQRNVVGACRAMADEAHAGSFQWRHSAESNRLPAGLH